MKKIKNESGKKFNRLLVINFTHINSDGKASFECLCDCGNTVNVSGKHLRSGNTKSCGCLIKEMASNINLKHGYARKNKKPKEYLIWVQMNQRCTNANNKNYNNYGGRGITVCDRWMHSFENFISDMGFKPNNNYSIDRIDNNGNYCPENCKWIPIMQQQFNKRTNRILSYNGISMTAAEWCIKLNINKRTMYMRLHRGWSDERCLTFKKI